MGYYTQYEVEMDKDAELVREYVNENFDGNGCLTAVFNGWGDELKWYGHEVDMRSVSRQFPDVLITLTGKVKKVAICGVNTLKAGRCRNVARK